MTLLAYAVRRATGALLVLLVVIWLIQLGVYHITVPPFHPVERLPGAFYTWAAAQPAVAYDWNIAALEVGGLAVVLGLGAAWRLRKRRIA
jgi:hypothetical protein